MNNVSLIGNISYMNNLRLVDTQQGQMSLIAFNVACNLSDREPNYIRVEAFGKVADGLVRFCKVGSKVGISGYLKNDTYVDKNGNKASQLKVVATKIDYLTSFEPKPENPQYPSFKPEPSGNNRYEPVRDELYNELGF